MRGLQLIANPDQWPDQQRRQHADQNDELAEQPHQHADDRQVGTAANQGVAGGVDALREQLQRGRGPAHAEARQSPAIEQEECDHRKREKEQAGVEPLGRQARDQQRYQQHHGQPIGQVDPPALGVGIEPVHELAEFRGDIGPARADGMADVLL